MNGGGAAVSDAEVEREGSGRSQSRSPTPANDAGVEECLPGTHNSSGSRGKPLDTVLNGEAGSSDGEEAKDEVRQNQTGQRPQKARRRGGRRKRGGGGGVRNSGGGASDGEGSGEDKPRRQRRIKAADIIGTGLLRGKIRTYNPEKGWGFIEGADAQGSGHLFLHERYFLQEAPDYWVGHEAARGKGGHETPVRVAFDIGKGMDGKTQARNVRVLDPDGSDPLAHLAAFSADPEAEHTWFVGGKRRGETSEGNNDGFRGGKRRKAEKNYGFDQESDYQAGPSECQLCFSTIARDLGIVACPVCEIRIRQSGGYPCGPSHGPGHHPYYPR